MHSVVEVLTPAESQDLISLAELKTLLQLSGTQDDVRLQTLISFASSVISGICWRSFGRATVRETFPGVAVSPIVPSLMPVVSVESVTGDASPLTYNVDNDYTFWRPDRSAWDGDIEIVYTGGYDLPDHAPGPLKMAITELVKDSYYNLPRDRTIQMITDNQVGSVRYFAPPGVSSGGRGGGASAAPASPVSPMINALIFPYKRLAM